MKIKIYLLSYKDISIEDLLSSSYISSNDISSLDKYPLETVKKEKLASIYMKNRYIGKYDIDEYGKPYTDDKYFNISHSYGLIALVVDSVPIGIDTEKIRPLKDNLISFISKDEEKEYIHDEISFYEIWTNKEALVKAEGKGINLDPTSTQDYL